MKRFIGTFVLTASPLINYYGSRKTTSKELDIAGTGPHRSISSQEEDLTRRPLNMRRKTSKEVNLKCKQLQIKTPSQDKTPKETSLIKDKLTKTSHERNQSRLI